MAEWSFSSERDRTTICRTRGVLQPPYGVALPRPKLGLDFNFVNGASDDGRTPVRSQWTDRFLGMQFRIKDNDTRAGASAIVHPYSLLEPR